MTAVDKASFYTHVHVCAYVCVCVQCVIQSITSIQSLYQQRALKAEDWRASQLLSLLSDSSKIMMVAHTDSVCMH